MNQIPCIENKCISYPVCISKSELPCSDLFSWFLSTKQDNYDKKWKRAKQYFKNITLVKEDDSYFTFHDLNGV